MKFYLKQKPAVFAGGKTKVSLIPLGGVGSVTKNMFVWETARDIVIIDCGVGFPDEAMPGIDLVIPDISYLKDRRSKIRAILTTHAHEDHIGALPYLLPQLQAPVYATRLTAGFINAKLAEVKGKFQVKTVREGVVLSFGDFEAEFVHVSHSVPDAANIILKTPAGTVFHASDFKFDWTPVDGRPTDVQRIAQVGAGGVLLLLSDCLRVEKVGTTLSERKIEETFDQALGRTSGKCFITTASSNISRIQQAVNAAKIHGRKVAFLGRSIDKAVGVARQLGYLQVPQEVIVAPGEIKRTSKVLIVVAGSQGQPDSALSQIAAGVHKDARVEEGDTVIFSADPIPGNEQAIHSVIDALSKMGAKVLYSDILDDLHVSGHGAQGDLLLMLSLVKPRYVLPIGGTYRHMKQYASLAHSAGYRRDQVFLTESGQALELTDGLVRRGQRYLVKSIMVDSAGSTNVNDAILRDRQELSQEGLIVVIVSITEENGKLAADPEVIVKGFAFEGKNDTLVGGLREKVMEALLPHEGRFYDWAFLRKILKDKIESYVYNETKRRPVILPVIIEV